MKIETPHTMYLITQYPKYPIPYHRQSYCPIISPSIPSKISLFKYNCKKTFINTQDEVEDFLGLYLLTNLLNSCPQLTFGFKLSSICINMAFYYDPQVLDRFKIRRVGKPCH